MRRSRQFSLAALFVIATLLCGCWDYEIPVDVWVVDAGAPEGGDGRSWEKAFRTPQEAVDAAEAGEEVWVAAGTYSMGLTMNHCVLMMKEGVSVYGGFAGREIRRDERDAKANVTVLDGLGYWHQVVVGASNTTTDGFTVRGGNTAIPSNSTLGIGCGAGMFVASLRGGSPAANVTISNCTFTDNFAICCGGGLRVSGSSCRVVNCLFFGNSANYGGGLHASSAQSSVPVVVENCVFADNTAEYGGGARCSYEHSAVFAN